MIKKITTLFFGLSLLLTLSSCVAEIPSLMSPTLSIARQTEDSFEIKWDAIGNAAFYTVNFQGRDSIITNNFVRYENLAEGVYTVSVTANAPAGSESFSNSQPATISVALVKATWFTQELIPYTSEETDYQYASYNTFELVFNTTTDIHSITYAMFKASESAEWTNDYAKTKLDKEIPSSFITTLNEEGTVSVYISDRESNTEYEFISIIKNTDGEEILRRTTASTYPIPAPHADIQNWLGAWEVTSSHTWTWKYEKDNKDNMFLSELTETPKTFNIYIEIDSANANSVMITGLSTLYPDFPARGIYVPETKTLDIYSGIAMGFDPLSTEYGVSGEYTWCANVMYGENGVETASITSGFVPVYFMSLNGTKATSERNFIEFQDKSYYKFWGIDVYTKFVDTSVLPSIDDLAYPINCPAGDLTWVKK